MRKWKGWHFYLSYCRITLCYYWPSHIGAHICDDKATLNIIYSQHYIYPETYFLVQWNRSIGYVITWLHCTHKPVSVMQITVPVYHVSVIQITVPVYHVRCALSTLCLPNPKRSTHIILTFVIFWQQPKLKVFHIQDPQSDPNHVENLFILSQAHMLYWKFCSNKSIMTDWRTARTNHKHLMHVQQHQYCVLTLSQYMWVGTWARGCVRYHNKMKTTYWNDSKRHSSSSWRRSLLRHRVIIFS